MEKEALNGAINSKQRSEREREGGKEDITEYVEIAGAVRILDQQIGQMDALKSYQT